jgi:pyruvate,orthophosphate dikinase
VNLDLDDLRRVRVRGLGPDDAIARGIPASVGVASGPIALDADAAKRFDRDGTSPVIVRSDAATEDISGIAVAAGMLTGAGGRTSHAAVVARELAKPCLVGCADLEVDLDAHEVRIGKRRLAEGDAICLDAEAGLIFAGSPALESERPSAALAELDEWRRDGSDRLAGPALGPRAGMPTSRLDPCISGKSDTGRDLNPRSPGHEA